ncbi:MAG: branched-chain amino acid ABC transporter substrate-binding protein [Deltaproteobacteria bacterium]|nr:branched-chain amino acid ABC transporter substrate-binding protein [Candidatus Anaeroferrophillus wilburensis]MBN2889385.1 branched-chain amino acid ABC transporter substrate-binding protein [Deltaproteobacteria bacterium]
MRKLIAGLVIAAFLAMPAVATIAETIRIGVAGPHTGDLAPYGIPTKEAALMVADQINAAGGVLGRQVEVLPLDDQCKPEIATNVATKLVSQNVAVVIGHICSGATKAALGIYKEAGIIVISPSATNPPLTQSGEYPNFYRTIAPDDDQGRLAATFVTGTLGARKVAILHDKGDYGKGFADFSKKFIEAGGHAEVVMFEGVTPGAMDYSAVVQKVRRNKADAVIFGGYHPEASKLVSQMKKKRVKIPFIGPDGIKGDGFLEIAGASAEGVYATGPMDVSRYEENRKAHADYVKRYGKEPGTFFDQGYAAMQAVLHAIETSGGTGYADLEKALKNTFVDTAVGTIRFDQKGDAEGVGFSVYQVRDGVFIELNK